MNAAFRSHLMQQFVGAAQKQARTPIALMGWVQRHDDEHQQQQQQSARSSSSSSSSTRRQQLSSIGSIPTSHVSAPLSMDPSLSRRTGGGKGGGSRNMSSTLTSTSTTPPEAEEHSNDTEDQASEGEPSGTAIKANHPTTLSNDLALSFQSLLLTRRTTSKYRTPASDEGRKDDPKYGLLPPLLTAEQYRAALGRAVAAGRAAPNHKRTEPFSFRRLLAPSESTERLAEIAEQVYLRQKQVQQQNLSNNDAFDLAVVQAAAQRKREKWRQIPAFLVTLVSAKRNNEHASPSPPSLISNNSTDDDEQLLYNKYDPLPYTPPASERALEDYAAACAATQNILLALHSEGLACKWATGPVIRTPAFRELVRAERADRVVALVMIGQADVAAASAAASTKPRRYRRALEGDVLRDL